VSLIVAKHRFLIVAQHQAASLLATKGDDALFDARALSTANGELGVCGF
jgi:hypothetical protein